MYVSLYISFSASLSLAYFPNDPPRVFWKNNSGRAKSRNAFSGFSGFLSRIFSGKAPPPPQASPGNAFSDFLDFFFRIWASTQNPEDVLETSGFFWKFSGNCLEFSGFFLEVFWNFLFFVKTVKSPENFQKNSRKFPAEGNPEIFQRKNPEVFQKIFWILGACVDIWKIRTPIGIAGGTLLPRPFSLCSGRRPGQQ